MASVIIQLIAATVITAAPPVDVRTTHETLSGSVVAIDETAVTLNIDGQDRSIPVSDVLKITLQGEDVAEGIAPISVTTVTGNVILARQMTLEGTRATLAISDTAKLTIAAERIQDVRLRTTSDATSKQWGELIARDRTADSLIIVQSPDALDFYDGVIKEVTTEIVKFDLEGDVIDVKREKLEGFVLFHPNARGSSDRDDAKDPHCIVHDTFGNAWPVTNVAVSSDSLQLTSVDGFVVDLPMSAVRVLDYASPRVLFLSDLEPVRAEVRPFVRSAANDAAYVTWFQPRRDVDFHGEPLSLATAATGKVTLYEKGVAVASQTELIYQLPATYNHLQAVVGMAPYVRPAGNAVLTISADGRTLYQQPVTGEQAAVEIDVALDGAKRLKLLVDYGEDMDVADHIHLCDLKVVK